MAVQQQTGLFGEHQHERAASCDVPLQRLPASNRDGPPMNIVESYLSSLKAMYAVSTPAMEGPAAGSKRAHTASHPMHNPFQSCTTQSQEPACWAAQDTRASHRSKRQRSCTADDGEDVAESMPWGPVENSAPPAEHAWQLRARDHSSVSAASTHWQVQIWPQPTFKLHRDVMEDDATSPLSAPAPHEQD
ncbi:hypothetical protein COCSUDRAFT_33139 [Coccomyxa subellipsoidea C-169]|uniref:Uncharacterized protein n=1 Tax=Coccomyxa subellipsoidea (strain C-169) TaxID=574566 RepID=I0YYZ7_COCSC|nr:hypothetical protein COCSUDRAFT_33139 [Coccomyxa subellipsoidea C-169]EIE23616.1 hypothetical protein COCSUDRAFT_33139 [Coccomyxa subellipsoidea C-169]|eukprot:XP_005648160.1 hypothetical protein COCSUDRAFT_33139 [Coccomyxa subellipsoidea C-169]